MSASVKAMNTSEAASPSSASPSEWWRSHLQSGQSSEVCGVSVAADPLDEIFFTEEHPLNGPPLTTINITGDNAGVTSLLAAFGVHGSRFASVSTLNILTQADAESNPLRFDERLLNSIAAAMPALTTLTVAATATVSDSGAAAFPSLVHLQSLSIRLAPFRPTAFLQALARMQKLQKLVLQGVVEGTCDLALLSPLTHLRSLDVSVYSRSEVNRPEPVLTTDAARAIFSANPHLTDLRLGPISCESTEAVVQLLPVAARQLISLEVFDKANNVTQPGGSALLPILSGLSSQLRNLTIDFMYPPTDSLREDPLRSFVRDLSEGLQVLVLKHHTRVTDKVLLELATSRAARSLRLLDILSSYGFSSNGVRALKDLSQLSILHVSLDWEWHAHLSNGEAAAAPKPANDEQLYSCFREFPALVELFVTSGRSAGVAEYTLSADVLPKTLLCLGLRGLSGAPASQADGTPAQESAASEFARISKQLSSLLSSSLPLESLHASSIQILRDAALRAGLNEWIQQFDGLLQEKTKVHHLQTSSLSNNPLDGASHARFVDPAQARAAFAQLLQNQS